MPGLVACLGSILGPGLNEMPALERKLLSKQNSRAAFSRVFLVVLFALCASGLPGVPDVCRDGAVAFAQTSGAVASKVESPELASASAELRKDLRPHTTTLQGTTSEVASGPGAVTEGDAEDDDASPGLEVLRMVLKDLKRHKEEKGRKASGKPRGSPELTTQGELSRVARSFATVHGKISGVTPSHDGPVQRPETAGNGRADERRVETQEGRSRAASEKRAVEEYTQREDAGIQPYKSECRDKYLRTVLEGFAKPTSFLEPEGLKAFSNFLATTLEEASGWLSKQSEYYRQSVDPMLRHGTMLSRKFASSYEEVFPEVLSAVTQFADSPHQQGRRQAGPNRPLMEAVVASMERFKEISWKLDAAFGEVSGNTRAYPCPSVCASVTCRWTCGLKQTLPAIADGVVSLTSQVAMIFEILQELLEGDVDPPCLEKSAGVSGVEVETAYEFMLSEAEMLSETHQELSRLVKSCGSQVVSLHDLLKEYQGLHID